MAMVMESSFTAVTCPKTVFSSASESEVVSASELFSAFVVASVVFSAAYTGQEEMVSASPNTIAAYLFFIKIHHTFRENAETFWIIYFLLFQNLFYSEVVLMVLLYWENVLALDTALTLLMRRIENPDDEFFPQTVNVGYKLIERESTAA